MSAFTANLSGFRQLEARMASLSKAEATKAGQIANRAGASVLAKKIRDTAPDGPLAEGASVNRVRKGGQVVTETHHKIKNWIKIKKTKSDSTDKVQNSVYVAKGYHAAFVEFGSIHNAPNPFFRTAFEQNKQAIVDAMKRVLERQLIKRGV